MKADRYISKILSGITRRDIPPPLPKGVHYPPVDLPVAYTIVIPRGKNCPDD